MNSEQNLTIMANGRCPSCLEKVKWLRGPEAGSSYTRVCPECDNKYAMVTRFRYPGQFHQAEKVT